MPQEEKEPPQPPIELLVVPEAPFNGYSYGELRITMLKVNEIINRINNKEE